MNLPSVPSGAGPSHGASHGPSHGAVARGRPPLLALAAAAALVGATLPALAAPSRPPGGAPAARASIPAPHQPVTPSQGAASPLPSRPERSRVTFLGWSPDGRFVAYRRQRWRRPRHPGGATRYRDRTLHREVRAAKLRGYGPPLKPDAGRYLAAHGYTKGALTRHQEGPRSFAFLASPGSSPLRLELVPGARLSWRITRARQILAERPFDRLYVAVDAQAFLSPQGDTLAVVLALDTGWRVDAALYLVAIPQEQAGAR